MGERIKNDRVRIINGLVNVADIDDSLIVDIKYSTEDNFMKRKLYPAGVCVLQLNTAKKLAEANSNAKKHGYRIKVFDGYRPLSVQKLMWDLIQNEDFVAPPWRGSSHNRGAAVDVTLVDITGNEVEMPSGFDEFSRKARIDYEDAPKKAIENRELLASIMVECGFNRIESEWWHFNDTDILNYPLLDIGLEEFL